MHAPPLVGWLLVLLCAGAGAYCLARAGGVPAAQRAAARGEGVMALGMAAMAVPASVAPPPWSPWLFTAGFGAAAMAALVRRHLHHAVGALTMVYMALAMVWPGGPAGRPGAGHGMAGMDHLGAMTHSAPGGVPWVTGLLLVYYTVYVIGAGVRLVPAAGGPAVAGAPAGAGGAGTADVLRACRVAMGIGMLAMLLMM
ncbi:DUF5134 domain-containing protein [Streptomyces nigrescens]|uniref:DUF5134 domain-containing protein n=1 Tax=Streptomyces nigrescens TaxID=1920 RepID=A0ABN6QRQ5_STRNI|nr:DUF5134 domain-containing protein [Streptomyces nigrescens]BDM68665.1 DUF5134 domain-containing protein [Streptomyces nigrescens]